MSAGGDIAGAGARAARVTPRWLKQARRVMASRPASILIYLAVIWAIVATALNGAEAMGYNWQWYRIPRYFFEAVEGGIVLGEIPWGLVGTLALSATAFLLATFIGLIVALLRLSDLIVGRWVARGFLEIVRNSPLLVLLYVFYYVFGPIFGLDRYSASVLCLAVFHGALISEIFRAGINAVAKGQWEAADAIGMTRWQVYRYIVLPQSVRFMLPPMTGEVVNMIKSSAIVSVIAVAELTTIGRNIISDTYMSFEIWFTIAAVYMVVTLIISTGATLLERRYTVRD
ncbi:amino acid ABC transporter permease [Defluviimonas sp. WL0050]|uniref:Amino acid ABC transporter permease n=1 Tax=Albidovulum litorale TaxID=2984134 RepID=A0ABT2ZPJ4_9RHOB|nr:amino acid ABC transporter permease [Defluviimonas sp. WL0050]MCV2873064.1 amino acid ABC transporter permease [Defluviimonas sp. WL0050]